MTSKWALNTGHLQTNNQKNTILNRFSIYISVENNIFTFSQRFFYSTYNIYI